MMSAAQCKVADVSFWRATPAPDARREGNRFAQHRFQPFNTEWRNVKQAFIPLVKECGFMQCHIAGRTLIEVGWQCLSEKKGKGGEKK